MKKTTNLVCKTMLAGAVAIAAVGCCNSKQTARGFNEPYTGEYLNYVAMPIGGMGAGMFTVEGSGAINSMSLHHRPELRNEPRMFAALSVKDGNAKLLQGPVPSYKVFSAPDAGYGLGNTSYGLPRYHDNPFTARFPFAEIDLADADMPVTAEITAWSPFIPTDADNSSLPVGAFEYKLKNTSNKPVEAIFSYSSENFVWANNPTKRIKPMENGFVMSSDSLPNKPQAETYFAIWTDQPDTKVNNYWFRGGWFDGMTMNWNSIKSGEIVTNDPIDESVQGATLYVPVKLAPGEEKTIKLMMAWYAPNSNQRYGADTEASSFTTPDMISKQRTYKPWYSSKFKSIGDVANYWNANYDELKKNSQAFTDALYSTTLPAEVVEAVASNLAILKSPTVMRQYDGRMWNWEGSADNWGSCEGSCTHVWNYQQAISNLFPEMERSLRETEFFVSQNNEGHQTFRSALPIRPVAHGFHAASDGQLGGIMKLYRDWRISGDNDWLKKMYPQVKASLDYGIRTWDPRHRGTLEEPHHNTYDIEFWGPDGMCTSFYLGALQAAIEMGKVTGDDVTLYEELLAKGKDVMENELYNGEYFIQKIQTAGLNAADPVADAEKYKAENGKYRNEADELLVKEGPKYQYGNGCISDGVLGFWLAQVSGLTPVVDADKITSHLKSIHKYNMCNDLSKHDNPQRPGYAMGEERGLLLCSWPEGDKLSLPFVYADEVWTGIEYQVAAHLMLQGQVEEGLDIVRACRERYDGRVRNPFNEYECGNYYGRALASYGLLQGLTGVRYDAVDKTLYVDSKVGDFKSFLSTNTGFGTVEFKNGKATVDVAYGEIPVENVVIAGK